MAAESDATGQAPTIHFFGRDIDLSAPQTIAGVAAAMAAAGIVIALISEAFGWKPCPLCYWQRIPYYVGLPVAALPLLFGLRPQRWFYAAAAAIFFVGFGLAVYHTLVEFGVLQGLDSCGADQLIRAESLDDFLNQTEGEVMAFCGARTPYLFGLTMSNLNALVSIDIAALFTLAALRATLLERS